MATDNDRIAPMNGQPPEGLDRVMDELARMRKESADAFNKAGKDSTEAFEKIDKRLDAVERQKEELREFMRESMESKFESLIRDVQDAIQEGMQENVEKFRKRLIRLDADDGRSDSSAPRYQVGRTVLTSTGGASVGLLQNRRRRPGH